MSEANGVRPEILRGIPSSVLMWRACACLRTSSDEEWYSCSFPVEGLTHFLSHCWKDARWEKALALMLHSTRRGLIWCTSIVVSIVAAVQFTRAAPLLVYPIHIGGLPGNSSSRNGFLCFVVGTLTWCVFLTVAPSLHPWERWFLDTACISQKDEKLKQEGIRALGTFLDRSDRMVLLLTSAYFERGWCTFEVATFLAHRSIKSVEIVPLLRAKMIMLSFGTSIAEVMGMHVVTYLGLPWGLNTPLAQRVMLPVWCLPTLLLLWTALWFLEKYMKQQQEILQKVATFTFAESKFTDEADREFVGKSIESLFGTIGDFELEVRSKVYQQIVSELGSSRQPLPYMGVAVGALPWIWFGLDMCSTDPDDSLLTDMFFSTTMALNVVPLLFVLLTSLVKLKLACVPATAPWGAGAVYTACAGVFAVLVYSAAINISFDVYVYLGLPVQLALWVSWFAITLACYCQPSCVARDDSAPSYTFLG